MQERLAYILPLADVSACLSQVGGKGASLARMAAAGLPVPPGFHVTTAAYRRFVTEHGLQEQILSAVSSVSAVAADQPTTLEEASQRIAGLFAQRAVVTRRDCGARTRDPHRGGLWQCDDAPAHRRLGAGQRRAGHGVGADGTGTDCDGSERLELINMMPV